MYTPTTSSQCTLSVLQWHLLLYLPKTGKHTIFINLCLFQLKDSVAVVSSSVISAPGILSWKLPLPSSFLFYEVNSHLHSCSWSQIPWKDFFKEAAPEPGLLQLWETSAGTGLGHSRTSLGIFWMLCTQIIWAWELPIWKEMLEEAQSSSSCDGVRNNSLPSRWSHSRWKGEPLS